MKLTRQQKVLLTVLGLAGGALVADRWLLGGGGPRDASATPAEASVSPPPADAQAPQNSAAQALPESIHDPVAPGPQPLSQRLETVAERYAIELPHSRDAFRPDDSWAELRPPPDEGAGQDPRQRTVAEQFVERHRLRAVMRSERGGMALIAGREKPLAIGEELDGFELISVASDKAVFRSGDQFAVLELQRPDGP